ncbi:MAG: YihY/virulence factor BrkB family protein [Rhizobiaceae bacterium]|nr:YihY/virulence factor BrkB family protein [Rhizobiaceae bacterium]MCV0408001.1 YihY/virulence factor BrkB family protein [Rhizobiaceae bacterium]
MTAPEDRGQTKHRQTSGHNATRPSHFTLRAWWAILKRVYSESQEDRVMLVAAGGAFYLLLALFPALAAFVSLYGFVADPTTIADQIAFLGGLLPRGGLEIIEAQLDALASQDPDRLSLGFAIGLAVALWSANTGVKTLFDAMNIAYEEPERRSFLKLNLASGMFTLAAMLIGVLMLLAVGIVPAVLAFLRLDAWAEVLIWLGRWPLLLVFIVTGISLLYRFGPNREPANWRWLSPGAVVATLVWIACSIGFSWYLQNFANYNATYGSLGAVIGFMIWTWLSVLILLIGAELNAEMERQTARDTTTGEPKPMGERGAYVADTVARD